MSIPPIDARLQEVLSLLKNVTPQSRGYSALCPAHDDNKPSLQVWSNADGSVGIKCYAGCTRQEICRAIGKLESDLYPKERKIQAPGCTLLEYSILKKLPLEFLRSLGLRDHSYCGIPSVVIPYMDERCATTTCRYRTNGSPKLRSKRGRAMLLYGLWQLADLLSNAAITLAEGESDTQTLWHHGFPAVGLPGASSWNELRDAIHLRRFDKIYVIIEPDEGGKAVKRWLSKSSIKSRAHLVDLHSLFGVKDPSELHCLDPEKFKERFSRAINSARSFREHDPSLQQERPSDVLSPQPLCTGAMSTPRGGTVARAVELLRTFKFDHRTPSRRMFSAARQSEYSPADCWTLPGAVELVEASPEFQTLSDKSYKSAVSLTKDIMKMAAMDLWATLRDEVPAADRRDIDAIRDAIIAFLVTPKVHHTAGTPVQKSFAQWLTSLDPCNWRSYFEMPMFGRRDPEGLRAAITSEFLLKQVPVLIRELKNSSHAGRVLQHAKLISPSAVIKCAGHAHRVWELHADVITSATGVPECEVKIESQS